MLNPKDINLSDLKWAPGEKKVVKGVKAAASTDNAVVTYTILKILEEGGNAVDGAIAGCMVQAAIEPFMTNYTGTVTFLFYNAKENKYYQLDSTGIFPHDLPAHKPVPQGMGPYAMIPPSSVIPGFMPGLKEIYHKFATKPWSRLCEDAIWWAENGHHVSNFEFEFNSTTNDFITFFPEGREFYMPKSRFPFVGERFYSKELAKTLKKVATEGPDHMITGEWADKFIEKANSMGWMIRKDHMIENLPRWIEPLRYDFKGHEILSLAPPQQQGIFIALVLGMLEHLKIESVTPYSAEHIFYMGNSLKLALNMCGYFNDPNVLSFDTNMFLNKDFHKYLAGLIKGITPKVDLTHHMNMTTSSACTIGMDPYSGGVGKIPTLHKNSHQAQPSGSCEISIVDKDGNWVQMMNTLQSGGIPGQVVCGVPMVGSHALPNIQAGSMTYYQIKGARMRSFIGNTMILKDGKPVLQLGSPGNVYCTIPQVLCNILFFGMEPYKAICEPRMLPVEEGGTIIVEDRITEDVQRKLLSMGIRMKVSSPWDCHMGSFQVCYKDDKTGELCTIADPRRCGVSDGIF